MANPKHLFIKYEARPIDLVDYFLTKEKYKNSSAGTLKSYLSQIINLRIPLPQEVRKLFIEFFLRKRPWLSQSEFEYELDYLFRAATEKSSFEDKLNYESYLEFRYRMGNEKEVNMIFGSIMIFEKVRGLLKNDIKIRENFVRKAGASISVFLTADNYLIPWLWDDFWENKGPYSDKAGTLEKLSIGKNSNIQLYSMPPHEIDISVIIFGAKTDQHGFMWCYDHAFDLVITRIDKETCNRIMTRLGRLNENQRFLIRANMVDELKRYHLFR